MVHTDHEGPQSIKNAMFELNLGLSLRQVAIGALLRQH